MNAKAEWSLHSQGQLRRGKEIPERGLPKSKLLGTTFIISEGFRYHRHYNLLDIYFQSIFPFVLKKKNQFKKEAFMTAIHGKSASFAINRG